MLPARPGRCRVQLHRMVPAPAPAPPHISTIYTDGDGQLWHRYTAVCCGAHTRSMHMFNYTICTHCEECYVQKNVRLMVCVAGFSCAERQCFPRRIVRSKCRAAAALSWTRQPPPSPPSPWTLPWWPPAPATRSSSWTSTGP